MSIVLVRPEPLLTRDQHVRNPVKNKIIYLFVFMGAGGSTSSLYWVSTMSARILAGTGFSQGLVLRLLSAALVSVSSISELKTKSVVENRKNRSLDRPKAPLAEKSRSSSDRLHTWRNM